MPSTQEFAYNIEQAYLHDNKTALLDTFDEYQRSHCYDPQTLCLSSAHDCKPVVRDVDCGHCYHCRETKINSWVTRMYAHCENFKYVYFVTLTYRPFYKLGPISDLVLKKLSGALFHYDNKNKESRYGWNPCVLCKRHYQTFLKRLRKNTKNDTLTYALSGEYGHTHGRPHYHIVLFSKVPVTVESVRRAWSIGMWKSSTGEWSYLRNQRYNGKAYYFEIGRIDFHDLVENGSFNECEFVVDGETMNVRNCFAYVCKYVCKGGEYNNSRTRLAYNSLFENVHVKQSLKDFDEFNRSIDYHQRKQMKIEKQLRFYVKNKPTDFITYEKIDYKFTRMDKLYTADLSLYDEQNEKVYPENWLDFDTKFGQFVEVSRGCPIGSLYAKAHISQFIEGHYAKPLLQRDGFVIPSYFRRKAEEHVYGLRKLHKTISGQSFVFTSLPLLLRHFEDVYKNDIPFMYRFSTYVYTSPQAAIKHAPTFKDISTGEYIIFPKSKRSQNAEYYRYNRSKRCYELARITSLKEFLRCYIPKLKESIKRFEVVSAQGAENARLLQRSAILLEEYGMTLKNLRTRFAQNQAEYLKHRDHTYHITHESVE